MNSYATVYCLDCRNHVPADAYQEHKKQHLAKQIETARAEGKATANAADRWLRSRNV